MSDKIYVGNGKVKEWPSGDKSMVLGFSEADVETMRQHLNDKGWVNVIINKSKKDADDGSARYYGTIDTWQPTKRDEQEGEPF